MADDSNILKMLKDTYDVSNVNNIIKTESEITEGYKTTKDGFIKMSSGGKDEDAKRDKIERNEILKTYKEQLSYVNEINNKESAHQKQLRQLMIKNYTFQKTEEKKFSESRLNNLKEVYEMSHNKEAERIKTLQDNLAEYYETALNENRELTNEELKNIKKLQNEIDNVSETGMSVGANKWTNIANNIIQFIADSAKKLTDIYFTDIIKKGINDLSSAYESNFTEIAGRTGSNSRTANHDFIKGVLQEVNSNEYTKEGLDFSTEVIPALTEAVKQGFMGEEAEKVAISNAIDKKIMPWLETSSETWVELQYQLSDDTLRQIKGQQLLLQETREGNRLLQTGVVGQLMNSLQPTLLNIETNTTDVNKLTGEAQAVVAYLMNNGYGQNDAIKIANQMIDAYQNPGAALIDGGSPVEMMMAITSMNGGDFLDIASTYGDMASIAVGADALGIYATQQAYGFNAGGITRDDNNVRDLAAIRNSKELKDLVEAFTSNQEEAEEKYLNEMKGLREDVTATQAYDNALKNWTAETGFDMNKIAHGSDLELLAIEKLQEIKNLIITIIGTMALNSITSSFGKGSGGMKGSSAASGVSVKGAATAASIAGAVTGAYTGISETYNESTAFTQSALQNKDAAVGTEEYEAFKEELEAKQQAKITGAVVGGTTGAVGGAIGGAAAGAAIGTVVPGIGNAIGAVAGGLIGFIGGLLGAKIGAEIGDAVSPIKTILTNAAVESLNSIDILKTNWDAEVTERQNLVSAMQDTTDIEVQRQMLIDAGIDSAMVNAATTNDALDALAESSLNAAEANKTLANSVQSMMIDSNNEAATSMLNEVSELVKGKSSEERREELKTIARKSGLTGDTLDKAISMIDDSWRWGTSEADVDEIMQYIGMHGTHEGMMTVAGSYGLEYDTLNSQYVDDLTKAISAYNTSTEAKDKEAAKKDAENAIKMLKADKVTGIGTGLDSIKKQPGMVTDLANMGININQYRLGSSYIPNDMIAQLHKGERVLTETQNKEYTQELLSGTSEQSIIQISIQDVVNAISKQTSDIINYLSSMNSLTSSNDSHISMLPSMGNTRVTV